MFMGNVCRFAATNISLRVVCTRVYQRLHRFDVAVAGRPMQRRVARLFLEVGLRSQLQEEFNDIDVAPCSGTKQGCLAYRISPIDVTARLDKTANLVCIAPPRGVV